MSENNHRNDFDDFLADKPAASDDRADQRPSDRPADSVPYYYSYGPYKQGAATNRESETKYGAITDVSDGGSAETGRPSGAVLDVYGPQPYANRDHAPQTKKSEWVYPVKKKTRFRSGFISFIAGALVVSSLMFAADKTNLFTGGTIESPAGPSSPGAPNQSGASQGGGVTQVALDGDLQPVGIAGIVDMASPAVVKIETYVTQSVRSYNGFDFFFGPRTQPEQESGELMPGGEGSGFFFDAEGYILTNNHVVEGAKEIKVQVEGYAEPFEAELLGSDADLDLAVLKVKGNEPFPTLKLGDSDTMNVGDWVVAIGNPYRFDHTVTVGVLSAKEREIPIRSESGETTIYKNLLQTDASINPGNSGGPLLNLKGEVIGINTAVSTQAQGIGFAIPTSVVSGVLDNLKNDVPIPKPYIGVYMSNLSEAGLAELGLENGVVIASVIDGSPAAAAQLQPYDVIVEIDGAKIESAAQMQEVISGKKVGDRITMRLMRDGQMLTAGLTIGDQNAR